MSGKTAPWFKVICCDRDCHARDVIGNGDSLEAACLDALHGLETEGPERRWSCRSEFQAVGYVPGTIPLLLTEVVALGHAARQASLRRAPALCDCGHVHEPRRDAVRGGATGVVCGVNGCGHMRFPADPDEDRDPALHVGGPGPRRRLGGGGPLAVLALLACTALAGCGGGGGGSPAPSDTDTVLLVHNVDPSGLPIAWVEVTAADGTSARVPDEPGLLTFPDEGDASVLRMHHLPLGTYTVRVQWKSWGGVFVDGDAATEHGPITFTFTGEDWLLDVEYAP